MLSTPWGRADFQVQLTPGFYKVSTPSHGGFMITNKVFRQFNLNPVALKFHPYGGDYNGYHCFEEDCEADVILLELSIMQPELFYALSSPVDARRVYTRPLTQETIIDSLSRHTPTYLYCLNIDPTCAAL